ncbi:MAG TPA: DUF2167 domain-containing protein [Xanthomonadaceae bacterium]|jgi:uncharacterized membrane-anchored protein
MRKTFLAAATAALLTATATLHAQDAASPAGDDDLHARVQAFESSLHYQQGEVALPGSDAQFHLGNDFRVLGREDADKVVEQLWGNPHSDKIIGMVMPAGVALDDPNRWAVVIVRSDDGHVADDDAAKIDYAELLQKMKDSDGPENVERRKAHLPEINLVGWAEPPRYDAVAKKLVWARELSSPSIPQHTLNYDIRVLGRSGYLSLNAVAPISNLSTVRDGMNRLLPLVAFEPGKRYADFNPSTDHMAAYGVAALVAGGIAAKAGLFAKIGVILLALKKFVIIIFAAIAAGIRKLFGIKGKDKNKPGPTVR